MCMRNTEEGCILASQMSDVKCRVAKIEAKQWVIVGCFLLLIGILAVITLKLLDSQIYLLSGEKGLKVISEEAHKDVQIIRQSLPDIAR